MIIGNAMETFEFSIASDELVSELRILPAYPNPFNPMTNIEYYIPESNSVKVSVFDVMGRQIDILQDGFKNSGYHSIIWDATNQASGVYYIQVTSNGQVQSQKVMLLK